ncbi:MAG: glycosyltransferase family 1 protein [Bacteroidota bacterium]
MKIGYDAKKLFGNHAGLGNYSRTLVENMHALYLNTPITLYTTKLSQGPATQHFETAKDITTHAYTKWDKALWRSRGIIKQLKRDGIDLYHGLSHEVPFGIHRSGIKSVVTMHDLVYQIYPQDYGQVDRWIFDAKFRYACQHADQIIAISESTKQDLIKYLDADPERISVVYQACHREFYSAQTEISFKTVAKHYDLPEKYLLVVGSIFPRKNLSLLLRALALLPTALQLPLVLVGKGDAHKQELLQLAHELGIEHLLVWAHNVNQTQPLRTVYQNATAFVYPSRYEGFGIPVVEALLSRTPVITTQISSLPEAGGPDSMYVDPDDPQGLAEAIERVSQDAELRKEMTEKGFAYATRMFGRDTTTRQVMGIYERVLNT